jgi:hypothetical protein
VFVKDVLTGHVSLASTATSGVKGNGPSYTVFLAEGGGTVAFRSEATNLDPADADSVPDIYAKELGDAQARRDPRRTAPPEPVRRRGRSSFLRTRSVRWNTERREGTPCGATTRDDCA